MKFDYFVNENKGIVAVKADDGYSEMENEMLCVAYKFGFSAWDIHRILLKYRTEINKIRGIARCSDKDSFDLCTGAEIAKLRFLRQYESYRGKIYTDILNLVNDWANKIGNRVENSYNRFCEFENKISDFFVQE